MEKRRNITKFIYLMSEKKTLHSSETMRGLLIQNNDNLRCWFLSMWYGSLVRFHLQFNDTQSEKGKFVWIYHLMESQKKEPATQEPTAHIRANNAKHMPTKRELAKERKKRRTIERKQTMLVKHSTHRRSDSRNVERTLFYYFLKSTLEMGHTNTKTIIIWIWIKTLGSSSCAFRLFLICHIERKWCSNFYYKSIDQTFTISRFALMFFVVHH